MLSVAILHTVLTCTTLWANSADNKYYSDIFFLFPSRKQNKTFQANWRQFA